MDKSFIGYGLAFLGPITLAGVLSCMLSISTYGFPMASYDVMLTHYKADIDLYSPIVPIINSSVRSLLGASLYPYWFILFALLVCFWIPYLLLFEVKRQHRYGVLFIYGTAIPLINFMVGLLPQAIIINLIILLYARPKWFWPILILATFTHTFGFFAIIAARAWQIYQKREGS